MQDQNLKTDLSHNSPQILVVGSINMDLVVRSDRLPSLGETLIGKSLQELPGGKGANQAVAAARLGASVRMIGRVGCDAFGRTLRDCLCNEGVDVSAVAVTPESSSGVAVIAVDDKGQNCITVVPGANSRLSVNDLDQHAELFADADVLLIQLEVPMEAVVRAIELARQHQMIVICDPAPVAENLPQPLLTADVLCPNESEASALTGVEVCDVESAGQAAVQLQQPGAGHVVVTMGGVGAVIAGPEGGPTFVPAFGVDVEDTTAAGDAFAGALGVQLSEGVPMPAAVRFANATGALAATAAGAQSALPSRQDVLQLLQHGAPGHG